MSFSSDLLSALRLPDQVRIGTTAGNKLLDVFDLLLLLHVLLHLVDLVLLSGLDIRVVVTTIVRQLLLGGEVHDVGADTVEEIL